MQRIKWRPPNAGGAGLLTAICALALPPPPGNASAVEFTVGSKLPRFSLKAPNGETVALEQGAEGIHLTVDGKVEQPKALAIHLLQPDCLQCRAQLKALQSLHARFVPRGLAVVGVSHRGDERALAERARELDIKFPLLHGTGSELAKQFAAGDTFGLVDREGVVRFAQVGYGVGDEATWAKSATRFPQSCCPTCAAASRWSWSARTASCCSATPTRKGDAAQGGGGLLLALLSVLARGDGPSPTVPRTLRHNPEETHVIKNIRWTCAAALAVPMLFLLSTAHSQESRERQARDRRRWGHRLGRQHHVDEPHTADLVSHRSYRELRSPPPTALTRGPVTAPLTAFRRLNVRHANRPLRQVPVSPVA